LRGIAVISAVTILAEIGELSRLTNPRQRVVQSFQLAA
jgi:hypothetical protein